MRFAAPEQFMLLICVALLAIFILWAVARKKELLRRFGDIPLVMKNAPYISFARQRTKALLLVVALVLIVLALARLQFGTHMERVRREGIDLMIAVDVSMSMLARDMMPSRLERAKQQVRTVIDRLEGDRVGLIAFAGEAFVQCPLTVDYPAAQMLLTAMSEKSVSIQGTSLAEAIKTAIKSFDRRERKHKVLLLMTDGETHDKTAMDEAERAREQGIHIYTVGIGSPVGEPIPVVDRTGKQVGFKKDEQGEVVVSRLDEQTLQKIALATGGKFYLATPGEMELDKILEEIGKLEKKELEGSLVTRYDDRFQWPLLFALFLIVVEFFIPERKKPAGSTYDV